MSLSTKKKQDRTALRKQRDKRRFAFLKQLRLDTVLSASAKMVLWALADDHYWPLADNSSTDERCSVGFAALGKSIGRSGRAAQDAIKEGQAAGWVNVSSIRGGGAHCTNRYDLIWGKKAMLLTADAAPLATVDQRVAAYDASHPGQSIRHVADALGVSKSAVQRARQSQRGTAQPTDSVDENPFGTAGVDNPVSHGDDQWDSQYAEFVEEKDNQNGRVTSSWDSSLLPMGQFASNVPTTSRLEGGRDGEPASADRSLRSLPLVGDDELAFQHLCEMWRIREQFWRHDEGKSREAFAAVCVEYGEQIRTEFGIHVGDYLLIRANVWIEAFAAAHPDGTGPRFLKKLEVWLGAPDGKTGDATPWWLKAPTPKVTGARVGGKPDYFAMAVNGGSAAL